MLTTLIGIYLANKGVLLAILGALFSLSEALSMIPSVQANGVFQAIFNVLKKLAGK